MPSFIVLALLAALAGCTCVYLSSVNQRWMDAPWPAWPARCVGAGLLTLSVLALSREVNRLTAAFIFLTALMLVFSALPYVGALLNKKRGH